MGTPLQIDAIEPPDLTETLQRDGKRIIGHGSFGTVYRCLCVQNGDVAVKAVTIPAVLDRTEKDIFERKVRRELGIWRRLDHPNIVPLLGIASGDDFGSDHPCMVSMWMPRGTLIDYIRQSGPMLSLASRIQLIEGSVSGLEYLHSKRLVHGDFHPGNILIDGDHNARLTDFGFSQTLSTEQDQLSYLYTNSVCPGAVIWAAPELLYPNLYPDLRLEATLNSDIYSLGSIILFILSGKFPWSRAESESKLKEFKNPQRPVWPVIPDGVWDLIERCWSPRSPRSRPLAQEVLSFSRDRLHQLLQPNPTSDINIVLFGPIGSGKSSMINLLSAESVAEVSAGMNPCTKRPRKYQMSIGERRFRLWDTMGFSLPQGEESSSLSPSCVAEGGNGNALMAYEQVHAVLRSIPDGVHMILLCARKDENFGSFGSLYWLMNEFFYGGRAPIAFVMTHFDTPDERWWECNKDIINQKTGIPLGFIPHARVTTVGPNCGQSQRELRGFLQTYATTTAPIPPCPVLSSPETALLALTSRCGLDHPKATMLVENFNKPSCPYNIVLFGEAGVGKSSTINLLLGETVAEVSAGLEVCTSDARPYSIETAMLRFTVWDTTGFNGIHIGSDMSQKATETADELVRDLAEQGGTDLLVFCKKYGKLTQSELRCFKLFEELFCEEQVPVAIVVTHLESFDVMEKWWDSNGEYLIRAIGRDVAGHACITSKEVDSPNDPILQKKLSKSRLSVLDMLEDCFFSRSTLARAPGTSSSNFLSARTGEMTSMPDDPIYDGGAVRDMTNPSVSEEEVQDPTQRYFIYNNLPSSLPDVKPKNVVLFGDAGVGKSSVINLMAGQKVAPISLTLDACTLEAEEYSFTLSNTDTSFRIFDTVGLEEPEFDSDVFFGAVEKAQRLVRTLDKVGGIDLLLFCIRGYRFTPSMQRTYRLFSEILCDGRVPVAMVITNLELEKVMENWWKTNANALKKYGIDTVAHACITSVPACVTSYADKRKLSLQALHKLFCDATYTHNRSYIKGIQGMLTGAMFRSQVAGIRKGDIAEKLRRRCHFSDGDAQRLAEVLTA